MKDFNNLFFLFSLILGSAGEARLSSASIEDDLDLSGFDVDFLSSLEKEALDLDNVFTMGEEDFGPKSPANIAPVDPLAGPLGGVAGMRDEESSLLDMEVFTDLSSMLGVSIYEKFGVNYKKSGPSSKYIYQI